MDDYNRREFVRTSLPGFLGLAMALPGLTAMATRANGQEGRPDKDGRINWDAFLEGITKEAARQHLDEWNEASYLKRAKALARRLHLEDPILLEAFKKAEKGIGNGRIDFDRLEKHQDFQISYLQFEKGEKIRHHDHPGMTGVLLCATGELITENFTLLDEEREDERLLLKSAGKTVLQKGKAASLTSTLGNIHRVEARALTQIIDVFAPPYNQARIKESKYFRVDEEPFEERKDVFEATVG
jgi:hypothetical protein